MEAGSIASRKGRFLEQKSRPINSMVWPSWNLVRKRPARGGPLPRKRPPFSGRPGFPYWSLCGAFDSHRSRRIHSRDSNTRIPAKLMTAVTRSRSAETISEILIPPTMSVGIAIEAPKTATPTAPPV